MNRASLIGFLGADPETRRTTSGAAVVSLRLATSETWKDKTTGERKERTEWHTIVIFNERIGEIAEKYTKKGSRIFIEGQLQTRKWQDQKGNDRWSTEIVLGQFNGQIELLDRAERRVPSPDDYGQTRTRETPPARSSGAPANERRYDDLDDDIPF